MKLIVFVHIAILTLIYLTKCLVVGKDHVDLWCPKNFVAKWIAWYAKIQDQDDTETFTLCVMCKPEEVTAFEIIEIEICLGSENMLEAKEFESGLISCTDIEQNYSDNLEIFKICPSLKPVCGLQVSKGRHQLELALASSKLLPCTDLPPSIGREMDISTSQKTKGKYDLELSCPREWKAIRFERLSYAFLFDPVLSLICKPIANTDNKHIVLVSANVSEGDSDFGYLLSKSILNTETSEGIDQKNVLRDSLSVFCGLKWSGTDVQDPIIQLSPCENENETKTNDSTTQTTTTKENTSTSATNTTTTTKTMTTTTPTTTTTTTMTTTTTTITTTTTNTTTTTTTTINHTTIALSAYPFIVVIVFCFLIFVVTIAVLCRSIRRKNKINQALMKENVELLNTTLTSPEDIIYEDVSAFDFIEPNVTPNDNLHFYQPMASNSGLSIYVSQDLPEEEVLQTYVYYEEPQQIATPPTPYTNDVYMKIYQYKR